MPNCMLPTFVSVVSTPTGVVGIRRRYIATKKARQKNGSSGNPWAGIDEEKNNPREREEKKKSLTVWDDDNCKVPPLRERLIDSSESSLSGQKCRFFALRRRNDFSLLEAGRKKERERRREKSVWIFSMSLEVSGQPSERERKTDWKKHKLS